MRVNYLLAAWMGNRRSDPRPGSYFLSKHIESLQKYKHNLDQITVIFAGAGMCLPDLIGNTPVVSLIRENVGLSYGSWSHAYDLYPDFDYYILMEDDYVFCVDSFDSVMVDLINRFNNCGYLCSAYEVFYKKHPPHAAISNGICRGEAMAAVKKKFGKLPYVDSPGYVSQSQIDFSAAFIDAGYTLADFRKWYACPYFSEAHKQIINWGHAGKEKLIVPVQMI